MCTCVDLIECYGYGNGSCITTVNHPRCILLHHICFVTFGMLLLFIKSSPPTNIHVPLAKSGNCTSGRYRCCCILFIFMFFEFVVANNVDVDDDDDIDVPCRVCQIMFIHSVPFIRIASHQIQYDFHGNIIQ